MIGRIIGGPITEGQWSATLIWTSALGLLALTAAVATHLRMHLAMRLGEAVVHDLRQNIFDHLQHLSMSYFDKTKVGRIIARLTSEV